MTDKQLVMQAIASLPEDASMNEITTAFLRLAIHRDDRSLFAKIYSTTITPSDLQEYLSPNCEIRFSDTITELQSDLNGTSNTATAP